MFERKKPSGKLLSLPIDQIHPSPFQARKSFDEQELTALAQSIRENGLLQPVTVRRAAEGYELVAGERRLRACQLAKMTTIPAILCSYADDRTAALGLLENIQRADLNPFEQAQGLRDVMVLWDCTQAEAAKRLGMAQPTFANKLRLLQLTADQRQFVLDNNLTERHARAVLRLPENRRSEALITIAKRRLNARQTDSYIEQLLNSPPKAGHRISMVRDVRIFVNTIDHAIRLMTDNGVPATAHREEIDFDTFCKVELRVAEVRACENLKESKKLLHLTVFDGERERCILSGIAKWFKPEDLIGKKLGIVCNLAPRPMLKGKYVSEGMIFAADTADGGCSIAFYGDDTPVGSRIH